MKFSVCATGLENADRIAARLASQRVSSVEVAFRYFHHNTEAACAAAGAAFRAQSVAIHAVHGPFREPYDLSHADEALRAATIEEYRMLLPKVAAAGAKIMVIHPGCRNDRSTHGRRLRWCRESLEQLAPDAERAGVVLALENMTPGIPGIKSVSLLDIVDEVNSPALGLCLDIGHAHMTEGVVPALSMMKRRLVHIHLHDNDGRRDIHFPPPMGTIDWEAFYRAFRKLEFTAPITLECSPWGDELPPPAGREMESDFTALLDRVEDLFGHLERRIRFEEEQRQMTPDWVHRAVLPHRNDQVV